jgi:hypothetical protein
VHCHFGGGGVASLGPASMGNPPEHVPHKQTPAAYAHNPFDGVQRSPTFGSVAGHVGAHDEPPMLYHLPPLHVTVVLHVGSQCVPYSQTR